LAEHWRRHPPSHILLAAWLGVEAEPRTKPLHQKMDFQTFFKEITGQSPPS
jgi:hypothetical protein